MTHPTADHQYHTLRGQIESLLAEGKIHSRHTSAWAKVETYWHVGDALQTHFRGHPRHRHVRALPGRHPLLARGA